jgi:hypothetical protein
MIRRVLNAIIEIPDGGTNEEHRGRAYQKL